MFTGFPTHDEVQCSTRTTSGTMITVPAGRLYSGSLSISGSIAVAGTSVPTVTVNGTNASPPSGTVVGRLNLTGLALTTVSDSSYVEVLVAAPPENSVTIDFTAGATGTNSATLNGFVLG